MLQFIEFYQEWMRSVRTHEWMQRTVASAAARLIHQICHLFNESDRMGGNDVHPPRYGRSNKKKKRRQNWPKKGCIEHLWMPTIQMHTCVPFSSGQSNVNINKCKTEVFLQKTDTPSKSPPPIYPSVLSFLVLVFGKILLNKTELEGIWSPPASNRLLTVCGHYRKDYEARDGESLWIDTLQKLAT